MTLTAQDWGLTPTRFLALPAGDRVAMIATTRVKGKMAAWEAEVQRRKQKDESKRASKG